MRTSTRPAWLSRLVVGGLILLIVGVALPAPTLAAVSTAAGLRDKDFRLGSIQPSSAQRNRVAQLGAAVRWNKFGTPQSLIKYGGWISSGLSGTPQTAARNWIRQNRVLFRLGDADVTSLELVASNKLPGTSAYVVLFRQRFGTLDAGQDGLITVGIRDGKIAYVASSAAGSMPAPAGATLSPEAAWIKAAVHVGEPASLAAIGNKRTVGDWTVFSVNGLRTPVLADKTSVDQRARLVAVPTYRNGARAAYETIVLDTSGAQPIAYTVFVDARSGAILLRDNRVDYAAQGGDDLNASRQQEAPTAGQFSGTTNQPNSCGTNDGGIDHAIPVPAGTRTISFAATATNPVQDIFIQLLDPDRNVLTEADTGTSPEAIHYDLGTAVSAASTYYARVCEYNDADDPFPYEGVYSTQDTASTPTDLPYPPRWKYFRANPSLANDPSNGDPYDHVNTDTRVLGCWVMRHNNADVPDCSAAVGNLQNLASRVPWDHIVQSNTSSFTTIGNNAVSGEAWTTPLTPGPFQQRPVRLDRNYTAPWTNAWNQSRCATTNLVPGGNDIEAAVTNLFVAHNRLHDWQYFLGFTEDTWNLQQNNFGNNPGVGQENDPEFGQAQAGALLPVEAGVSRDNANQVTLNDGIPGITNMYLWQPLAGGFYARCVDGDYDMSVIAHEYTHATSNRMAGGPDASLSGTQAGAMGEGWSDLVGMEYLNEYGLVPTNNESRFAVGPYVTGNNDRGIRNYNMSNSPLNYSDIGYDFVCNQSILGPEIEGTCPDGRTQVHADGEIWSAVNFDLRKAFINRYDGSYPSSNSNRQKACADGKYPASQCPGNRRWIQIMFDAWLLMPASVTMLDARDAYLAADRLRFNGANQKLMWKVFAQRGMGVNAEALGPSTTNPSDTEPTANDPKPGFQSPLEGFRTVKFRVLAGDEGNAIISNARIYVGRYEAAATPVADTIPGGTLTDTAPFVNGDYEFLVVAPGYGHVRFPRSILNTGPLTLEIKMPTNRASLTKGAVVVPAATTGTNANNMFDDTELTNWTGVAPAASLVTVDLQGGVQNVKTVQVSAMLNPQNGGRFRALRQFEIWTCNGNAAKCGVAANYTKLYTSPANAFPGVRPRPTAPDLIIRSFDVPDTNATHVQLRVVANQCTANNTGFRGDQDADPLNDSDCVTGSDADLDVKAAELQVFGSTPVVPARDPAVVVTTTAPATVTTGDELTYEISYTNAGPAEATNAVLTDVLPEGTEFVSASDGGTYSGATGTVTWNLGTVNVGFTGTRTLTVLVTAPAATTLTNSPTFTAPETIAVTTPAVTEVLAAQ